MQRFFWFPVTPDLSWSTGNSGRVFLYSALICGAGLLFGCAGHPAASQSHVVKLDQPPQRETDAARALNEKAAGLIERGDYTGAEGVLKRAIAADAEYGPARNNLGVVYYRQSKLFEAKQAFMIAAELLPNDADPRNGLGLVFESAGRFDDAVNYFDRARALGPGSFEYLGNAARARFRRGDRSDELRSMLSRIAAEDPRNDWSEWARKTLRQTGGLPATRP